MNWIEESETEVLLLLPLLLAATQLAGVRFEEVGLPIAEHEFGGNLRVEPGMA